MVVKPKRILWPTDFSALSLHGARYARAFRESFNAELHVIHVIPPPLTADLAVTLPTEVPVTFSDQELIEACRARLASVVPEQFGSDPPVVSDIIFGNAWHGICKYAESAQIDLIIVATHGRTGLRHVLIGSTAERIVQHAPCPVLVVKNPATDFVHE
ncbi:MAG: universal stress protein [Phycisphaerae bacterium]|jgi:nucleotide-binding universal stress UspA family protein|nr:universal stress protein [Phycisphaerae bacterium]